jgi:hypothetical protein
MDVRIERGENKVLVFQLKPCHKQTVESMMRRNVRITLRIYFKATAVCLK